MAVNNVTVPFKARIRRNLQTKVKSNGAYYYSTATLAAAAHFL